MSRITRACVGAALALGASLGAVAPASAAEVLCESEQRNHMWVQDTYVSACIDAGVGNIGQGNLENDDFLAQFGAPDYGGYVRLGPQDWTQTGETNVSSMGTFSIDANAWNLYSELYLGFKFGTGNQPDEWFVYRLVDGVTEGDWRFVDITVPGGQGLSHLTLYGREAVCAENCGPDEIPEPGTIALAGLALLGLGMTSRRRRR